MSKETADILRKAKALIDTPEKWTQGSYARNSYGNDISWYSEYCVCFCSSGAIYRAAPENDLHQPARDALMEAMGTISIVKFNDTHTHSEVMAAFDRAIASEEAQA